MLETTLFGLSLEDPNQYGSHFLIWQVPDYVLLAVGGDAGIGETTRLHLRLARGLGLPVAAVITKVDVCSADRLQVFRSRTHSH